MEGNDQKHTKSCDTVVQFCNNLLVPPTKHVEVFEGVGSLIALAFLVQKSSS